MNLANWLWQSARAQPNAPALFQGSLQVADYAMFGRQAAALGESLARDHAITPGDRIGMFMNNSTGYLVSLFGVWWCGAVVVPINAKLHRKEAAQIISDAETKLVVVASEPGEEGPRLGVSPEVDIGSPWFRNALAGAAGAAPAERNADDLAWLFYTSGTTGKPKGAMLSFGNLAAMSLSYLADVDQVEQRDAALYAAPLSHGAGLYSMVHVRKAARHVVPRSGGFDAAEVLDLAAEIENTSMFAAPTMVRRLTTEARRRGSRGQGIKTIVYGGGPMYLADLQEAIATFGQKFVQIYGQGETPMTITALSREDHDDSRNGRLHNRLGSVGRPHSVVSVRITDKSGTPVLPGTAGEIEVKGPTVMLGYWRDPGATAKTVHDGWLRTGDVGYLEEDGFLTLTDRSKDVIISGGTNIYPREIEEVLLAHPSVSEVAVVGEPDIEWGENIVAFIVLSDTRATERDLDEHCLGSLARFKRPKRYVLLSELPKNNYGKILKTSLREQLTIRKAT